MSENEKTPTDAGTPVETEIAADEQTPDAGGQATTKGAPATASATPAATESSAAEQRGEVIGERLAALEAEEKANAATPEGEKADRKKHVGVIVAAVVFAVLLIGAGVAYSVLAPTVDDKQIEVTGTDAVQETEVDATADADVSDDIGDGNGANAATTPAPDFTMTDADGATLTLADFKGKPVLLNFWASWCGPCASEMPDIQSAWEEHGNDVEFVIVNMTDMNGETEQSAKAFLAEINYTFPCYFDANNSAATAFGVSSIPQTYLSTPRATSSAPTWAPWMPQYSPRASTCSPATPLPPLRSRRLFQHLFVQRRPLAQSAPGAFHIGMPIPD